MNRRRAVVAQFSPGRQMAGGVPTDARYRDDRDQIQPATTIMIDARPKSVGVAVNQNTIKRSQP